LTTYQCCTGYQLSSVKVLFLIFNSDQLKDTLTLIAINEIDMSRGPVDVVIAFGKFFGGGCHSRSITSTWGAQFILGLIAAGHVVGPNWSLLDLFSPFCSNTPWRRLGLMNAIAPYKKYKNAMAIYTQKR
jgi:hypothetical protein